MENARILIIDDDTAQRIILEKHLTRAGYQVVQAEDGMEGLDLMWKNRPDLVLLDIHMPVMDGFETIDAMKKNDELADIPVLFLTSQERDFHKIKGLELGADDYVTKPYNARELLSRIKAILRRSGKSVSAVKKGHISGDISDMGLLELLQGMETGLKTAKIVLKHPDGEILIRNGQILRIRHGSEEGVRAFLNLLLLEEGEFSVSFEKIGEDVTGSPVALGSLLNQVITEFTMSRSEVLLTSKRAGTLISQIKDILRKEECQLDTAGRMQGDLSKVGLAELLQNMEQGRKSAYLIMPGIDGEVFFKEGELLMVRQGNYTGDDALLRMLLLEKGNFFIRFDHTPPVSSDTPHRLMSSLMKCLAKVDEIRDVIKQIQAENGRFRVGEDHTDFPMLSRFKGRNPLSLIEMITEMDGDLMENLKMLIDASKTRMIKLVK